MIKVKFALRRKSGYVSRYSLGMLYPSYRKGLLIQGSRGEYVAPILLELPFGQRRWIRVWPPLVRFPSWVSRKAHNRDENGFIKP